MYTFTIKTNVASFTVSRCKSSRNRDTRIKEIKQYCEDNCLHALARASHITCSAESPLSSDASLLRTLSTWKRRDECFSRKYRSVRLYPTCRNKPITVQYTSA